MFSTRVPPFGAAPRLRRPRPTAWGLVLAVCASAGAALAQPYTPVLAPPGDPVTHLRDLLKGEAEDLAARNKDVTDTIDGMDLEQLSRVLLLQEWRDLENSVPKNQAEFARKNNDLQARAHGADLFVQKAKAALEEAKSGSALVKAATADLIGETAIAGRKLDLVGRISSGALGGPPPQTLANQLSGLTDDLIQLTKPAEGDDSTLARRAAAKALGEIRPADPKKVAGALTELLDQSNPADLRLTAAEALDHLADEAAREMQDSLGLDRSFDPQFRFADTGEAVWQAVLTKGLADGQPPEVRRVSVSAFGRIASEMLDISVLPDVSPPPASPTDSQLLRDLDANWNRFFKRLADVFQVFDDHADVLAAAAQDPDSETRERALAILVDLGNARDRLQRLRHGGTKAPTPGASPGGPSSDGKIIKPRTSRFGGSIVAVAYADEPEDPKRASQDSASKAAISGLRKTLDSVAAGLRAPDAETRRAAIDVFEILGPTAFPTSDADALAKSRSLLDALTQSLADPDRFACWAAARTIGKLTGTTHAKELFTPEEADAAVRGLADLMTNEDVGVRMAAANALVNFGKAAHSGPDVVEPFYSAVGLAAPVLTRSINHSQTAAALRIVPTPDTEPDLVEGDPGVRLAALTALEAMARPETAGALPEAEAALTDHNAQVRQAAAEMIGRVGKRDDVSDETRQELIRALGKALNDPEGEVRLAASGALLRLMKK